MQNKPSRRHFVLGVIGLSTLGFFPGISAAAEGSVDGGLAFLNLHTGEYLSTKIRLGEAISEDDQAAVNQLLRDHRSGDIYPIDPDLLKLLLRLQEKVGVAGPFHVISCYRSPATNARLRSAGHGVVSRSLHLQGKAIDIRLPGCELEKLRDAAIALKAGGVGYYERSNFLHVDTGRVRYW